MSIILEGIVTTTNDDGGPNISPMGPKVSTDMQSFVLRPFQTSRTYQNLKRHGQGVLHVTDDVLLLAKAAVHQLDPPPPVLPCPDLDGFVLADCCHWYSFEVAEIDDREARTTIQCRVLQSHFQREFFGFNRAKHAILEIAILATRIGILDAQEIKHGLERWSILVSKTGGEQEHAALKILTEHIEQSIVASGTSS